LLLLAVSAAAVGAPGALANEPVHRATHHARGSLASVRGRTYYVNFSINGTTGEEIDFANSRPGTGTTINL
jgi:hypothetical protein